MADIFHDFPIQAPSMRVFEALATPRGLDTWWTKTSGGYGGEGTEFDLGFGPGYDWRARVTKWVPGAALELQMTQADPDWLGTRIGFRLVERAGTTQVQFYHTGWPTANDHWRTSCYCWAMYLRVLRRNLEFGEEVPYERRLDV